MFFFHNFSFDGISEPNFESEIGKKIKTMADVEVASIITAEEEPTKDIFDVVKDDGKKYTNFTLLTLVCRVHNNQLFFDITLHFILSY